MISQNMFMIKYFFLLFPILFLNACMQYSGGSNILNSDSVVYKENLWPKEDEFYTVFYPRTFTAELRTTRPSISDTTIQFCIPVAFTLLDNDSIDGLFIVNGKIEKALVNTHLGGGLLIRKNGIDIIKTDDGKLLTKNWSDSIAQRQESFFQQIQLVRNGVALDLHKDQKLFQRRAIVIFQGGEVAVIESKNAIKMQEFADDLVKLKIWNAIYTDMGSFDEGWYRNQTTNRIESIGHNRSQTSQQSNWLIFRR